MTPKQLDTFIHLSETLNFRKTAEHLFFSQTTVTFQIQSLEEEMNIKLFERNKRSVKLTPAGLVFRDYARQILDLMNQATENTIAAAKGFTGLVRIGFSVDTNKAGIADLIRDFSAENPQIQIILNGGYPEKLYKELLFDRCDLIVTPYSRKLENKKLEYYKFGKYKQIAAFSAEHAFNQKKSLKFEDFADESFIWVSNDEIELDFTEEFIKKLDKKNIHPKTFTKTDNIDTVLLMLDVNMGITVIPEYFTERLAASSRIRMLEIDEELKGTELVVVWKKDNQTGELNKLIDYTKKYFPNIG